MLLSGASGPAIWSEETKTLCLNEHHSVLSTESNALDDGKAAIDAVLDLLARSLSGDEPAEKEWKAARKAALSAAESAAWSAAGSAAQSAANAAWYAADSAANAAWYAADSAADAADAADSAADAAWYAVLYAARSAQRDEFLRLLTEAT